MADHHNISQQHIDALAADVRQLYRQAIEYDGGEPGMFTWEGWPWPVKPGNPYWRLHDQATENYFQAIEKMRGDEQ